MTLADWTPLFQGLISVAAAVLTGLAAIYVPRAIAAFETRTGLALTDQQRQVVLGAAQTAAGIVQTKLDQGLLKISQVSVADPTILSEATQAILRVPDSATALKTTPSAMAAIIVGRLNTAPSSGAAP